ncbi:MAG: T9SS type A sorting domain-containing protein, partial [Chitinophagaceae bacterium]|nr:T9SS type A sorting domain-containing protein [Chitinophagaceae bacterium]
NRLLLQPNPGTEFFEINGLNGEAKVHMYDMLGHLVWSSLVSARYNHIDVKDYLPGVYVVKVMGVDDTFINILQFVKN